MELYIPSSLESPPPMYLFTQTSQQPYGIGFLIIPAPQMRKLRRHIYEASLVFHNSPHPISASRDIPGSPSLAQTSNPKSVLCCILSFLRGMS